MATSIPAALEVTKQTLAVVGMTVRSIVNLELVTNDLERDLQTKRRILKVILVSEEAHQDRLVVPLRHPDLQLTDHLVEENPPRSLLEVTGRTGHLWMISMTKGM